MNLKVSSMRLAIMLMIVALPAAALAELRPIHPWYSSGRYQIGFLPIPITATPVPVGAIRPPDAAAISVGISQGTTGGGTMATWNTWAGMTGPGLGTVMATVPSGRSIMLPTSALTNGPTPMAVGVIMANPAVFSVSTTLTIALPNASATFARGNRTGPPTVTFCAGQAVTSLFNPNCINTLTGPVPGRMTYTRTANQFGGKAPSFFAGNALVFLGAGGVPPCDYNTGVCAVAPDLVTPANPGAAGNSFGFFNTTSGTPLNMRTSVIANAFGSILAATAGMVGPPVTNYATSFGGPWTTGMVKISQMGALPGPETYTLTGSDTRGQGTNTPGEGVVSLVAGAISQRSTSQQNANRGFLKIFVPEPGATLGAIGALLALVGCHGLTRRRAR